MRHLLLLLAAALLIVAGFTINTTVGLVASAVACVAAWVLLAPLGDDQ